MLSLSGFAMACRYSSQVAITHSSIGNFVLMLLIDSFKAYTGLKKSDRIRGYQSDEIDWQQYQYNSLNVRL